MDTMEGFLLTSTPKTGHRRSVSAIAEFDPFSPLEATPRSKQHKHSKTLDVSAILEIMQLDSPLEAGTPPVQRSSDGVSNTKNNQLRKELMSIASHLEQTSPRTTLVAEMSPKTTESAQSTPKNPFSTFARKRAHRKAHSLAANTKLWKEVQDAEAKANDLPDPINARSSSTNAPKSPTPLPVPNDDKTDLQSLWLGMSRDEEEKRMENTVESLYIPNLAKPRPTSLLKTTDNKESACELQPSSWQMVIPPKSDVLLTARLSEFLDSYRQQECLLDLASLVGFSRMQLAEFAAGGTLNGQIADLHRPVVETLLDACGMEFVQVRGYFHSDANDPDERREVLILECQRQFVVVFRGTTAEQQKMKQSQQSTVELASGRKATVLGAPLHALMDLEARTFGLLDQLTEGCPFCDVFFSGHGFGASMSILAAYLYAHTRSDQRVAALVFEAPKVGHETFRSAVHALSNLRIVRAEIHNSTSGNNHGKHPLHHVGHVLRISPSNKKKNKRSSIKALAFHEEEEAVSLRSFVFKRDASSSIRDYVTELEDLVDWAKAYHKQDGEGVRGNDKKARIAA